MNNYIEQLKKDGKLNLVLETFSIYLLANLITNLDKKNLVINIPSANQILFSKEIYILLFLISAIISATFYFLSNKNIVKAKLKPNKSFIV